MSSSRYGVTEGSAEEVPALKTELGVVFLLLDRLLSRILFLLFAAEDRGGMSAEQGGKGGSNHPVVRYVHDSTLVEDFDHSGTAQYLEMIFQLQKMCG